MIPFCIILFADGTPLKDEKIIFHNINSKAVPIKSEQLLRSVVIVSGNETDFSNNELEDKFGFEYMKQMQKREKLFYVNMAELVNMIVRT